MKNVLLAFCTSLMGSIVAFWILNGLRIDISSEVWGMIWPLIPAVFILLFVLFLALPRIVRGFVRWRKDLGRAARNEELEHF